jgi:hypothetical protein
LVGCFGEAEIAGVLDEPKTDLMLSQNCCTAPDSLNGSVVGGVIDDDGLGVQRCETSRKRFKTLGDDV